MKLGIGIMAHPTRLKQAGHLAEEVDADTITVDWGSLGELDTGFNAWGSLADMDTDWSIVLQDDALPVLDFRKHAALALAKAPSLTAVSFYVGTCRPRQRQVVEAIDEANMMDAPWLQADRMLWGPAIAMPTVAVHGLLEYWYNGRDVYDQRIGFYWQRLGIPINYTWPSLVDHADGGSLVQKRDVPCPRVAHRIGTRESWDGPVVRIAAR